MPVIDKSLKGIEEGPRMSTEELNAAKFKLDQERLIMDREKVVREKGFLFRHSGILITATISLATVVVAIASVLINLQMSKANLQTQIQETKRREVSEKELTARTVKETERKASLDLLQYITSNYDVIYSQRTDKQIRIRNVMESAFPEITLERAFANLAETAPTVDGPNVWQVDQRRSDVEGVTKSAEFVPTIGAPSNSNESNIRSRAELLSALTGSNRRLEAEKLAVTDGQARKQAVDLLLSSLLPQTDKWSYRFNLYSAFTLAKMSKGWSGSSEQYLTLRSLVNSGNYRDTTFRTWVDKALANYKGV